MASGRLSQSNLRRQRPTSAVHPLTVRFAWLPLARPLPRQRHRFASSERPRRSPAAPPLREGSAFRLPTPGMALACAEHRWSRWTCKGAARIERFFASYTINSRLLAERTSAFQDLKAGCSRSADGLSPFLNVAFQGASAEVGSEGFNPANRGGKREAPLKSRHARPNYRQWELRPGIRAIGPKTWGLLDRTAHG